MTFPADYFFIEAGSSISISAGVVYWYYLPPVKGSLSFRTPGWKISLSNYWVDFLICWSILVSRFRIFVAQIPQLLPGEDQSNPLQSGWFLISTESHQILGGFRFQESRIQEAGRQYFFQFIKELFPLFVVTKILKVFVTTKFFITFFFFWQSPD